LPSTADLVDVLQHFGRVFIDAERARLLQLLDPVAAAHQADAERTAAHRGEHVPDAVADHHGVLDRRTQPLGGGQEQVGIRLGVFHLVPRDDRGAGGVDAERREVHRRGLHPSAGGDGPGDSCSGQPGEQFSRARQRADGACMAEVGGGVELAEAVNPLRADLRDRSPTAVDW